MEWIHQLVRTFRRGIECPPNPYFSLSHIHSIAFPTTSQLQCKALALCINMAFDEIAVVRPYGTPADERVHARLATHKVIRWSRKICDYTPSRSVILLATDAIVHAGIAHYPQHQQLITSLARGPLGAEVENENGTHVRKLLTDYRLFAYNTYDDTSHT